MVWLGDDLNTMAVVGSIRAPDVVIDNLKGAVCGSPVDNQMYDIAIILLKHAVECALQHLSGIVGYRDVSNDHCILFIV